MKEEVLLGIPEPESRNNSKERIESIDRRVEELLNEKMLIDNEIKNLLWRKTYLEGGYRLKGEK